MKSRPIGIFDSGLGGLTVVKAIQKELPKEKLVYFGDTARIPYGTKSPDTIVRYARQIIRFFRKTQKVKCVVVACNTSSAWALETVRKEFSIPILGVIEPGAYAAVEVTRNGRIGIIGTEGTIASGAYVRAIRHLMPKARVFSKACPLFCPSRGGRQAHRSTYRSGGAGVFKTPFESEDRYFGFGLYPLSAFKENPF